MNPTLPLVQFLISMVALLIATTIFIRLSIKLSRYFRLSPLVIGTTVVAIGTSLPEITIASIGAFRHDSGLALGNLLGSNIINCLLITGVAILIGDLRVGTTKTQRNAALMLFTGLSFIVLYLSPLPARVIGQILLAGGLIYSVVEYWWGVRGRKLEDVKAFLKVKRPTFAWVDWLYLIGSLVAVVIAGQFTIDAVEQLSLNFQLNKSLLGMTLIASLTTLPELITTLTSHFQHQAKLVIGNILGSNLYNLFLVGGIALLFGDKIALTSIDWVVYTVAMVACVALIHAYSGRVIPRLWGLVLLAGYMGYWLVTGARALWF